MEFDGIFKKDTNHEPIDWDKVKKDREEYFENLRKWLESTRVWNNMHSGFPQFAGNLNTDRSSTSIGQNSFTPFTQNQQPEGLRFNNLQQGQNDNTTLNGVPFYQTYPFIFPPNLFRPPTTYEFIIPPLWKRFCAEVIDFSILFIFKLILTFLFLDFINLGNTLDLYGLEAIQKSLEGAEIAYPLAFELLLLELIHRVVVCFFEAYFLRGKTCSTPGKRCMGLMVVNVETISAVPNRQPDIVTATGVKSLGWQKAMLRSMLKNLIVGLLLPLCITFYVFPFNRTSYDMMSNSVVVEVHLEFLMYQNLIVT